MCNGGRAVATTNMYMLLAAYLAVLIVVIRVLQRVLQAHMILSRLRGRAWSSSSPAATVKYSCPKRVPHVCNSCNDNGWFATWPEDELAKKEEQIAHSSAETDTARTVASELDVSKPDVSKPEVSKPVNDDRDLDELRKLWLEQIKPRFEPLASADPFLSPPDVDNLLLRFLDAERGAPGPKRQSGDEVVQRTAKRLEATAAFRRDYDTISFHKPGAARTHMMHASNAGASVYFGDCGLRSPDGCPVLLGRVSLMTDADAPGRLHSDTMLPAQHLRAAVFVCERSMVELMHKPNPSLKAGRVAKAAYILDVGHYPKVEMAAHGHSRYWHLDGESTAKPGKNGVWHGEELPMAGPCLAGHHALSGLGVLKEAMRLLERFYPEGLHTVYFYRPGAAFRMLFAVFRLWARPSTRDRFVLVRPGEEDATFFAPPPKGCGLRREDTPKEFGGTSETGLDGDRFLLRACERYDATAAWTAAAQGEASK